MNDLTKGNSPFHPGQPVPLDLFVGRVAELQHIMVRGAGQVTRGKPIAIFVEGEYGIGKSSFAGYVQASAEREHNLHGIYASLGRCRTVDEMAADILEATIRSGALNPGRSEKIKNWLARYVGQQSLFSFSVNLQTLKEDALQLTSTDNLLSFLRDVHNRLQDTGIMGISLVLDEINGIVDDPRFAPFIKSIVDSNALSRSPLPLLLMICGVPEKRGDMIRSHEPVARIFDVVEIGALKENETQEFFEHAFQTVQMKVDPAAMDLMVYFSAGFPKIMHLIGDAAYWIDRDAVVDESDAVVAIRMAAEEVGKRFVDQQVYEALKSDTYKAILQKISGTDPGSLSFLKRDIEETLTENEKKKFNNLLQKMKQLHVLRTGEVRGEYIFNMRMVRLYLFLQSKRLSKPQSN